MNNNTFKSDQTKRVFNIYQTITRKNQWIIYLLECIQFYLQYLDKSEITFDIRLNNHREDVGNLKPIPACVHFRNDVHKLV